MNRKNYLVCILFVLIVAKVFSCPHLEEVDNHGKWCKVARVYMDDTLPEWSYRP